MPLPDQPPPAQKPQPTPSSHLLFTPRKLATPLALAAASSLAAALLLAYLASPAAAAAKNPPPIPSFSYAAAAASLAIAALAAAALSLRSPLLILDPAGIRFRHLPLTRLSALAWPQISSFSLSTHSLTLHSPNSTQLATVPLSLLDHTQLALLAHALEGRLPHHPCHKPHPLP